MVEENGSTNAVTIGPCAANESGQILTVINAAAEAYRGVIPADRWHEPYMSAEELASEVGDGVRFIGYLAQNRTVGVMGVQRRRNVDLIRHAYVLPEQQGRGVGSALLRYIRHGAERPILIGTWQAAEWAIRFYERHGFSLVADDLTGPLLRTYWNVPERQIATSVVLASPALTGDEATKLMARSRADL